jgi:hypothetical protein
MENTNKEFTKVRYEYLKNLHAIEQKYDKKYKRLRRNYILQSILFIALVILAIHVSKL